MMHFFPLNVPFKGLEMLEVVNASMKNKTIDATRHLERIYLIRLHRVKVMI